MVPKHSIESVLQVTPAVSDIMSESIRLWSDLYVGRAPWLREPTYDNPTRVVSLGIPALLASEKARMVTLEMKSVITQAAQDENAKTPLGQSGQTTTSQTKEVPEEAKRADFLNRQYYKVLKQIRRQLEYGIAKGGLVIKPYIVRYPKRNTAGTLSYDSKLDKAEIEFDFIQADRFFPLAFDSNGKVIEAAFIQTKADKAAEKVYVRLEHHKLVHREVTVNNLAFESTDMSLASADIRTTSNLGNPISLANVPEWASLQPTTVISGVDRLLFAYFKMPDANTIDPYSPLGVSGYSRVIQLIKDADMQYSRLLWEFEGGELAVEVDRDALMDTTDHRGRPRTDIPQTQQRLFRKIDLNSEDTYKVFSPPLRDTSLIRGLNTILIRIEDATGVSRGTLSEVTTQEAKTATELKILKQRSYATNADIQAALQEALEDLVYVMDVYCTLYDLAPPGEYEISFEWDDSIIVDNESELSKRITLMQNGLASKLETRMWYYGETAAQARAALDIVDKEAADAAERKAKADAKAAEILNKNAESGDNTDPSDTTHEKKSTGKQADSLDNPDKSKVVDAIKGEAE